MKKMYITIDTEMDANCKWKKMWPPEYSSIYEGIPLFFRPLWDKYNVHPIYFVSPEILLDDRCCSILQDEIKKGAVIGAHLHPEYIEPMECHEEGRQTKPSQFPCSDYSYDIEREKLVNLTELIQIKLNVKPIWYRAARFGADSDTYKILDELGYKYDSSVTPGIDWSKKGGMNYLSSSKVSYCIEHTGVVERPVTVEGKRFGIFGKLLSDNWLFYKWLRPTHMTYFEMKKIVDNQIKINNNEMVMMFHSMEIMINKTPYVRNGWMQKYYYWRLSKILGYAQKKDIEL